jgi:membrane protein YdbS with pleckstrin-like domain
MTPISQPEFTQSESLADDQATRIPPADPYQTDLKSEVLANVGTPWPPSFANGKLDHCPISLDRFHSLDPRSQRLESVGWLILTGFIGFLLSIGWLVSGFFIREQFDLAQWISLGIIATICMLGILASRYFPAKVFQSTSWQLTDQGLEVRRGIWWRHRIFVPTDRIQHTDVIQGPIMRMYGLANLVINTGGTHEPSIPLEGLSFETAEQLRELLSVKLFQNDGIELASKGTE